MQTPITIFYAILLGILLLILTLRVIDLRGSPATSWMHKQPRGIADEALERAIRGHGNLIEYMPSFLLFLLFLLLAELQGAAPIALYISATLFTLGRYMHGFAFAFSKHSPVGRIGGMSLSLFGLIGILVVQAASLF